jgi:hypothetical protein
VKTQFLLPAAFALALAAAPTVGALAQDATTAPPQASTTSPQPPAPGQPQGQRPAHVFHSHIEGRIAYMKAELKITPEQTAQFNKLAAVMRDDDAERAKSFQDRRSERGQHVSAVDRLDAQAKATQLRAHQDERYLAAFKPLYDSLSDSQKQAADQMLAPRHFGSFGGFQHRG